MLLFLYQTDHRTLEEPHLGFVLAGYLYQHPHGVGPWHMAGLIEPSAGHICQKLKFNPNKQIQTRFFPRWTFLKKTFSSFFLLKIYLFTYLTDRDHK